MRVFVTGATGFIGSALVPDLIAAGHQVLGLARSDAGAQSLIAAGAEVHRGHLEDTDSLRSGVAAAGAVIHTAFIHDFSRFQENCEIDRRAIEAMGAELLGTNKLLIVTSGTGISSSGPGLPATENDPPVSSSVFPRAATEEAAAALTAKGVRVAVMRLPQVHDTEKQGLVTFAIQVARQKGIAAYIGEGKNRWPACPRFDAAHLYRLALEMGEGGVRYNAVAEEGVPARAIAEAIGRGLNIPVVSLPPEEAPSHFGWLASFMTWDIPASSAITREKLGWTPTGPTLLTDLANMRFNAG
jgi:nucleoside-diphosphate-sugar epimerase